MLFYGNNDKKLILNHCSNASGKKYTTIYYYGVSCSIKSLGFVLGAAPGEDSTTLSYL